MACNSCGFPNYNGRIWVKKDPILTIPKTIVVGKGDVKVKETQLGIDTQYEVSYEPYSPPKVELRTNRESLEVGEFADVVFTIIPTLGSEIIKSTVVSPVQTITNNTFTALCGDNQAGLKDIHTVTLIDNRDTMVSSSKGINVYSRYMIGSVLRNTVSFNMTGSKLAPNIRAAYGDLNLYTIPEGQNHVAWLVPRGETLPKVVDSNGFEWETMSAGNHVVEDNGYGLRVEYTLMMTKNFYVGPDDTSINLKFN